MCFNNSNITWYLGNLHSFKLIWDHFQETTCIREKAFIIKPIAGVFTPSYL